MHNIIYAFNLRVVKKAHVLLKIKLTKHLS